MNQMQTKSPPIPSPEPPAPAPRPQRLRFAIVVGFAVAVLVIAGLGFVFKMTEFAMTIIKDDVEGFGATAVAVYLLGVVPMLFLNLWAVFTGRFRDIEGPKYRLLELDEEIERGGDLRRKRG